MDGKGGLFGNVDLQRCHAAHLKADTNAYAERWVRSAKEDRLTKLVLFGEASLRRALADFIDHYHGERNHQGKGNTLLFPSEKTASTGPAAEYAVGSGSVGY
jgi:hypothetical protein